MKRIIIITLATGLMLVFTTAYTAPKKEKHIWGLLKMYEDGSINIPPNECPSEKGQKEEMIEIRDGKVFKNQKVECNEHGKQYRVRMKKKDGSEEETYVYFPLTWVGDSPQPNPFDAKRDPVMGFKTGTLKENTINIKIPYSDDLEELIFEDDGEEDDSIFLSDILLIIDIADIKDVSNEASFQGSPNDGFLDINFLGSSYPNTNAGTQAYINDCTAVMNQTMATQPFKKYQGRIRFNRMHSTWQNMQNLECWPIQPNEICNSECVGCHAKKVKYPYDEVVILEYREDSAIGGMGFIDCPEFFPPHPQNSENTWCWAFMGTWASNPNAAAKAAVHEMGHSIIGLMDEYLVGGTAPPGALPVCRRSDSNCSTGCGVDSWVPETGCGKCNNCWYGCYYADWIRCGDKCIMTNFNNPSFCSRCQALGKKKIGWELEQPYIP